MARDGCSSLAPPGH